MKNTDIREFCLKYKEKLRIDAIPIKTGHPHPPVKIEVYLAIRTINKDTHYNFLQKELILDNEDLEIIYEKYSKKLDAEMQSKIEQIKHQYKDIIPKQS